MNTSKWTRVFIVKSATRIERQGKWKPREEGATEKVRGTSHRPRSGPILHTGQGRESWGPVSEAKTRNTSQLATTPPPPAPTDWPIFLAQITHVLVGKLLLVSVLLLFKTGCCKKGGGCLLIIIGLRAAQVLKYSTNASPKFHGETSDSFYNNDIYLFLYFYLYFYLF